jgi:RNA polymerase sigma factor (sigma-70 family)
MHSDAITEQTTVPQLVDHLCRHQSGQVVATLTRLFGLQHLDLAEDVVQETLIKALHLWSYRGIPENPGGWIMTVARNQALDILRRERRFRERQAALVAFSEERNDDPAAIADLSDDALRDDMLRMMFICCHPAIAREAQIALILKTLGGFGVAEIAHAFLAPEATIAQRLVRAKRTIRAQSLPFAVPDAADLPARLDAVLAALYLLFNEGYSASQGDALVRHDLCAEAIRLMSILAAHPVGDRPNVHALRALMLLHAARLPARTDAAGDFLLLETQDHARWDTAMIHAGLDALARSAGGDELTAYHLQAGIAACHALAPTYAATDWPRILAQYDDLLDRAPSPVVALNRAVAVAMVQGPSAGLAALDTVRALPGMANYAPLHATIAEFRQRLGEIAAAVAAYDAALALTLTEPERRFLLRKRAACVADATGDEPPSGVGAHRIYSNYNCSTCN